MTTYTDQDKSITRLFEESIKKYWDSPALTNYGGDTIRYCDLAVMIEKIHILFDKAGIKPGDNIALCGRNSSHWAVSYLATMSYGAVAVPILHEFKPEQVKNILAHSESKLLFVGSIVWKSLSPELEKESNHDLSIISMEDFSIITSPCKEMIDAREQINLLFGQKYPKEFTPADIHYHIDYGNALALINYTSGSTGKSKGVMIPQRALWNNVQFLIDKIGDFVKVHREVVSILPMAHMYGLAFELISEMCTGMHVYYITRLSPTIIFKAFAEVKPAIIVSVPLIIEKVMRKTIMPKMTDFRIKTLLRLPVISQKIKDSINAKLKEAFGGQHFEIIVGGAAFSRDVETLMHEIGFNYTVGYGATECAPLITYADWYDFKLGSCGKAIDRMEVRIDSSDPQNIVGEILVKGDNVMLGYYRNEEATKAALDSEGWYHTGDLGIIDEDGFLFIRGRSKNMLLGPSGQNIYPEEIEDKLNAMQFVAESVVIQRDSKLYALIYPDLDEAAAAGIAPEQIADTLEQIRKEVNTELPAYEQIIGVKVMKEEFEKTPKKSIKRFLYVNEEV